MAFLLAHHGRKQLALHAKAIGRVRSRPTARRIHALRVALKQLRTLLRLAEGMDAVTRAPAGALRRPLSLFKAAGELREAQVSMAVVRGFDNVAPADSAPYLKRLELQRAKASKALQRTLEKVHARDAQKLEKYLASVSTDHSHSQERKAARLYVDREMRRATRSLRMGAEGDALHDVRKHLKNAWHALRLLAEADTLTERQTALLQRLGTVQESLGEWHDLYVVFDHLERQADQDAVTTLKRAVRTKLRGRHTRLMRELKRVLEA